MYRLALGVTLSILVGGVGCAACEEDDLGRLEPLLEFEPETLAFGPRTIDQGHVLSTTAHSRGSADLVIEEVRIDPAHAPFVVNSYPEYLAISDSGEVSVTFTPGERGDYQADAVFVINIDGDNEVRLPLSGSVGPPRIEVSPAALDFGTVNQDTGNTLAVRATNVGNDWLELSEHVILDPSAEFTITEATFTPPELVEPGDYRLVHVKYVPADLGGDSNALRITSNAENGPYSDVPLTALGNLSPVVVAFELSTGESEVTVDPDTELTLSSAGTYDPEGEAITLAWQIYERPAGASVALPASERDTPQTHITPPLVGDYIVRLLATDPGGAQGYADVTIHAIRDLVVRMTWETAVSAPCQAYSEEECAAMDSTQRQSLCCGQTDIDLHLVAPGGDVGDYLGTCPGQAGCSEAACGCVDPSIPACVSCRSDGLDCAYANRNPDWGDSGDPFDDPSLDVDDVRGAGPEIISLNGPADGDHLVYVHYCNDRIGEATLASVEVFIRGELRFSAGPQALDAQDKLWLAVILTKNGDDWSGVTPASVSDSDPELCAK